MYATPGLNSECSDRTSRNPDRRITIPFKSIVTFKDGHNGFMLSYSYPDPRVEKIPEVKADEPVVAEVVSLDAFRSKNDEGKGDT